MRVFNNKGFQLVCLACLVVISSLGLSAEKENSGWSLYVDNDIFIQSGESDKDYTGGVAFNFSGSRVLENPLSTFAALEWLNRSVGFESFFINQLHEKSHNMEFGFTLFTPEKLDATEALPNEHPYASLFFVNSVQLVVVPAEFLSYQSSLTIGFLGLPAGGELHESLHDIFDADTPRGWDHQISAGGELTFKYSLMRSKSYLIESDGDRRLEMKVGTEANLGFSTDVGTALSFRWGRIKTPWWSFNPHSSEYINLGTPIASESRQESSESYLWFGANLRYRLYNSILQGQFRDSDVTFEHDQLNPLIAELWLGYAFGFGENWQANVFVRTRSNEIDLPDADNPAWGGFILTKAF